MKAKLYTALKIPHKFTKAKLYKAWEEALEYQLLKATLFLGHRLF